MVQSTFLLDSYWNHTGFRLEFDFVLILFRLQRFNAKSNLTAMCIKYDLIQIESESKWIFYQSRINLKWKATVRWIQLEFIYSNVDQEIRDLNPIWTPYVSISNLLRIYSDCDVNQIWMIHRYSLSLSHCHKKSYALEAVASHVRSAQYSHVAP